MLEKNEGKMLFSCRGFAVIECQEITREGATLHKETLTFLEKTFKKKEKKKQVCDEN